RRLLGFLADTVERFQRETGISARFHSDLDEIDMPRQVCRELARIVQEGLVNVRKHSRARQVLVRLGSKNQHWTLVMEDDGCGFPFAGRLSHLEVDILGRGPLVIKERVRLIDGEHAEPGMPGLVGLREMRSGSNSNAVRVSLLTAAAEKKQIVEALQLGARGVVMKDSATQLLLKSIHTVMAGEYWVGRESVSNLVQYLRSLVQSSGEEARQKKFGLTPRELEIVSTVVAGYSNKEIAEYCKISEDTVK